MRPRLARTLAVLALLFLAAGLVSGTRSGEDRRKVSVLRRFGHQKAFLVHPQRQRAPSRPLLRRMTVAPGAGAAGPLELVGPGFHFTHACDPYKRAEQRAAVGSERRRRHRRLRRLHPPSRNRPRPPRPRPAPQLPTRRARTRRTGTASPLTNQVGLTRLVAPSRMAGNTSSASKRGEPWAFLGFRTLHPRGCKTRRRWLSTTGT